MTHCTAISQNTQFMRPL